VTNRSRTRWSLGVALAAHALVLAWTLRHPRTAATEPQGAHAQAAELEIAVEPPAAPSPPPAPASATTSRADARPEVETPRVASRTTQPRAASASSAATPDVPAAPSSSSEPAGDGSWTFSPTRPPAGTAGAAPGGNDATDALGKATAAGIGAVLAAAEKKAEDRARRPLIFTARDMDVGLMPGGQYVPITRDRVRNSLVPLESHALLEFWTDSKGLVARVRVLSASSDQRAWDDVANALVEDAHATFPLKVPSNADGLIVTLDVTSAMKTLSGNAASRSTLSRVAGAIMDPADALMDAKAVPQRVVAARVVHVEAF
jgi:hypothetical protein